MVNKLHNGEKSYYFYVIWLFGIVNKTVSSNRHGENELNVIARVLFYVL